MAKVEDIVGSGVGGRIGPFPSSSSSGNSGSGSGGGSGGTTSNSTPMGMSRNNSVGNSINNSTGAAAFVSVARNVQTMQSAWAFQLLPELYNHYQKVADIFRRPSVIRAILSISSLVSIESGAHVRTHASLSLAFFPLKCLFALHNRFRD